MHEKAILSLLRRKKIGFETESLKPRSLLPFQTVGAAFLVMTRRGILADDTGLGKTVEALAALAWLHDHNGLDKFLWVSPASVIYQTEREIRRWVSLEPYVLRGSLKQRRGMIEQFFSDSDYSIGLINYELLRSDYSLYSPFFGQIGAVVFDECATLRNDSSQISVVSKYVALYPEYIFGLSATPIQNNALDLWCQLNVIRPDLFILRKVFVEWFCIEKEFQIWKDTRYGRRKLRFKKIVGSKNVETLRTWTRTSVLKRKVSEVMDELPPLAIKDYVLPFGSSWERKVYNAIAETHDNPFTKLVYEEEICACGALKGSSLPAMPTKYRELFRIMDDEVGDEKVIIFSRFKHSLVFLAKYLKKRHIRYVSITGSVKSKEEREKIRQRFMEDDTIKVLVGTQAIEVGLNLPVARHIIFLSYLWNPARLKQIYGRIRRIGSERGICVVHRLFIENSAEDHIRGILAEKEKTIDDYFGEDMDVIKSMSLADAEAISGCRV